MEFFLQPGKAMESREAWSALQSHLTTARAHLDAGDYSAALDAVNAALAIDPAFLAAHSLRERIELDRAKAATSTEVSRRETITASTDARPANAADKTNPVPTPRAPSGRRFGVLLAGVHEKTRSDPAPLVEPQVHRTALPPLPISRDLLPATQAESPPTVAPQTAFPTQALAAPPDEHEDREAVHDTGLPSESVQDPDGFDLRLNADDHLGNDEEPFTDDWSRTASRGPRLVFISAAVLVALIVAEGSVHLEVSHFTSLIQFLNFRSAAVNPASEPDALSLLTARPLEYAPVELVSRGQSMGSSALAPRPAEANVKINDAPTIRSVTVSSPVPASTLSRTTAPLVNEAPAAPPEAAAVAPTSLPAAAVPPTTRTVDAEPASYTQPTGETAEVAPAVGPSSAVDEQSVKTALQRYRNAYERLDAKSARTVWPSVNEAALTRAFDSLQAQTLTFTTCDVDFRGPAAVATCEGSTKYTPRYGSHEPRVEPRVWTFTLRKLGAEWKIDSVKAGR